MLAVLLPWWASTALEDREARLVLDLYAPFARPSLDLTFPKVVPYDPHSFVGRGRHAGLWEWTPEGLALSDKGRRFFTDAPTSISGNIVAGQRRIKSLRLQETPTGREVEFVYQWTEVSEPAGVLLDEPPQVKSELNGRALLVRAGDTWQVKSLRTPDYDETASRLLGELEKARKQASAP